MLSLQTLIISFVFLVCTRSELVCEQEPIELGIVLDSSRSVLQRDFEKGKQFIRGYLENFAIGTGQDDIRVSIIPFGYGIYPEQGFNLTTFTDKEDVLDAISSIEHQAGPFTSTGEAIKYMHEVQLNNDVVRPWAAKVGLVITDGDSQEYWITEEEAFAARSDGITMFAVGVGRVKDQELLNIAGDIERVKKVSSYSNLAGEEQFLANRTCIKKIVSTSTMPTVSTTPAMGGALGIQDCRMTHPVDIQFIFSPADLGLDASSWATSFISSVISFNDKRLQFGLTTAICPEDSGFKLNRNTSASKKHLEIYDKLRLSGLVQHVVDNGFTVKNGGRQGAKKVAILITYGNKGGKGSDLAERVKALNDKGVEVFLANPTGEMIDNIDGATALSGRFSKGQAAAFAQHLCE